MVNQALAHNSTHSRVSVWPQGTVAYVNSEEKTLILVSVKPLKSETAYSELQHEEASKLIRLPTTNIFFTLLFMDNRSTTPPSTCQFHKEQGLKVVWAGHARPGLMAHPQTFSPVSSIMNSYFHYKHHICFKATLAQKKEWSGSHLTHSSVFFCLFVPIYKI